MRTKVENLSGIPRGLRRQRKFALACFLLYRRFSWMATKHEHSVNNWEENDWHLFTSPAPQNIIVVVWVSLQDSARNIEIMG
jgi:hypothetical protein